MVEHDDENMPAEFLVTTPKPELRRFSEDKSGTVYTINSETYEVDTTSESYNLV